MEILKLIIPFLGTPKDYSEVLKKLASFAFYDTFFIMTILRSDASVDRIVSSIETSGSIGKLIAIIPYHDVIDPAGIVVGLLVALFSNMFQFHDRISDIFKIRRNFDCKNVLVPLARCVGTNVDDKKIDRIIERRDELMHTTYYKYASSRSKNPLVDKHDIEHALNAWSWFWVFVEATSYFAVATFVAFLIDAKELGAIFLAITCFTFIISELQYPRLKHYSRPQIETISRDSTAAYAVKQIFDAV